MLLGFHEIALPEQGIGGKLLDMCVARYSKIQWSAAAENDQIAVFVEHGFAKSGNQYLAKGSCPV